MRTVEKFSKAHQEAMEQAIAHKKDFWVVPLDNSDGYAISSFEPTIGLPAGTEALKVTPEDALKAKSEFEARQSQGSDGKPKARAPKSPGW